MSTLNESIAKKIGKLVRVFASNFEGEAINALTALRELVVKEGLTFHDLAIVIENHQGEIEELKYSDADMAASFDKGIERGREEEARKKEQIIPADYYDESGQPRWNAIALFCQKHRDRLRPAEQQFIDDMAGNTMWREPTEKQGQWLLSIFVRLGGRRAA
jgi:hypothetical protein